jgi:hypothetical protein
MIAVGIKHRILDENIYKSWMRSALIKDFNSAESYIAEVRKQENNQRIFCEYEWLAIKWGAKSGHPNHRWWR